MPRLLPVRSDPPGRQRLMCSVCRNAGDLRDGLDPHLFDHWQYAPDIALHDQEQTPVETFELRTCGDDIEMLEAGRPASEWRPFRGLTVVCLGCLQSNRGHTIYNPRSGQAEQL